MHAQESMESPSVLSGMHSGHRIIREPESRLGSQDKAEALRPGVYPTLGPFPFFFYRLFEKPHLWLL